ncbi:MAG: hypothetical protein RL605_514, partial [Actinomycetota bacterium]
MVSKKAAYRKLYPSKFATMRSWVALTAMVILFGMGVIVGNAI